MNKKRNRHFRVLLSLLAVTIVASLLLITDKPSILAQSPDGQTQGSQINYVTSQAWITLYDGEGGFDDIVYVPFGQEIGYNTKLSSFISHVVDTFNNSYVLNWRPNSLGKDFQLCGLRVAYHLPLEGGGFSSLFSYVHVPGSVMRPLNSSSNYAPDGSGGCIYLSSGDTWKNFSTHLSIPDGSRIDYLRVFYYQQGKVYLPIIVR